jgi:transposase
VVAKAKPTPGAARRSFTEEFKSAAVQRVIDGETLQSVADDVGVHVNVLRGWRTKGEPEGSGVSHVVSGDIAEDLKRENALLRAEIEYIRKREAILRR